MRAASTIAILALALAAPATAQLRPPPPETPNERRDEIPLPPPGAGAEDDSPLSAAPEALPQTSLPALRVAVHRIVITGNTVLPGTELERIAARFAGRELVTADIEKLRRELTVLYVQHGYVTSGAVIPDQDLAGGELRVHIVEGRVGELIVSGHEHFRESYLRDRVLPDPDAPLDVTDLEERLQILQASPRVASVHAELRPGLVLGESVLRVRVVETRPYSLAIETANDRSPAIGETNFAAVAALDNLNGRGDRLEVGGEFGTGLTDVRGRYAFPLNRWGTRFDMGARWSQSEIVEAPFDVLDIESDYITAGAAVVQPLWTTRHDQLETGVIGEWRRGRTSVLGFPFSFSEGANRGVVQVAPLRPFLSWVHRDENQVIALRAQVSFGLPILGATDRPGALADGTFVAGLLQGQWARRFEQLFGSELILRGDLQLAADPLLSLEQYSLGGQDSVRGYRQNQVVADNGFAVSLETRVPVWRRPDGSPIVQLAPFVDVGRAWNVSSRPGNFGQTLASVGIGLRVSPLRWLRGELYWGQRLIKVPNPHDGLADAGVYFRVVSELF